MGEDNKLININDSIDLSVLDLKASNVAKEIISEDNSDRAKDLINLFNLYQQKKNVIRVLKLNGLLDNISDQMLTRVEKKPDEFSNADLAKWAQITQDAIDKAQQNLNLVTDIPIIQQSNNQINVNIIDSMNKESRDRVIDAIKSILSKASSESSDIVSDDYEELDNQENSKEGDNNE